MPAMETKMEQAKALYQERLRATLETAENLGKLLFIEPESGDYQLTAAVDYAPELFAFWEAHNRKHICTLRVGYTATFSQGSALKPERLVKT